MEPNENNGGERWGQEEALAAQDFATKKEGVEFSEQASPEAYAEAEQIIGQLRDSRFDWVGVDWEKLDLQNITPELTDRVNTALDAVSDKKSSAGGMRRILPILTATSLLVAACAKNEPTSEAKAHYDEALSQLVSAHETLERGGTGFRDFYGYQLLELQQCLHEPGVDMMNISLSLEESADQANIQIIATDHHGNHHVIRTGCEIPDSEAVALSTGDPKENPLNTQDRLRLIRKDREMSHIIQTLRGFNHEKQSE